VFAGLGSHLPPAARARRLKASARKGAGSIALRMSLFSSAACAALHAFKFGAKRAAARANRPRLSAAVAFVCDVLLPTNLYGPLLGGLLLARQLLREDDSERAAAAAALATAARPPPRAARHPHARHIHQHHHHNQKQQQGKPSQQPQQGPPPPAPSPTLQQQPRAAPPG
jgi:hypothetical protein